MVKLMVIVTSNSDMTFTAAYPHGGHIYIWRWDRGNVDVVLQQVSRQAAAGSFPWASAAMVISSIKLVMKNNGRI